MKPLSPLLRTLLAVASLSLLGTYFLPLWSIQLWAPQYPEGIEMKIWIDHLSGSIDTINGLNHYIGMKHISEEMFPELDFLVYVMGAFIAFGLLAAWVNRPAVLAAWAGSMLLGSLALLADMYRWGYDYGHNLDPTAAIKVPGLTYQPPLIGYKQLLNFGAYSIPDTGGWIFGGVLTFALLLVFVSWKNGQFEKNPPKGELQMALWLLPFLLLACTPTPEPLQAGKHHCASCKMPLSDLKFGAELVTDKGKVFTFDDLSCLLAYRQTAGLTDEQVAFWLVANYQEASELLEVENAWFLVSPELRSPMQGNVAAFANEATALAAQQTKPGQVVRWQALLD